MEHAQRVAPNVVTIGLGLRLNPYFNGTCSKSFLKKTLKEFDGES